MPKDRAIKGDWNVICDVCGFKKKASEVKPRWDGLWVCKEDWESRHPQDFIHITPDDQSVPFSRPDEPSNTETFVDTSGWTDTSEDIDNPTGHHS